MNGLGNWLLVAMCALVLGGCASLQPANVKPTPLAVAQQQVPEDQLLEAFKRIREVL